MKIAIVARLSFAVAIVLPLLPAIASAQTGGRAPVHPASTPVVFGNSGKFKSTDGTSGTFKQTETIYDLNVSHTVTTVYTRASDAATRTEMTDYLTNPDGTHAENSTVTDYGASASSTSSQTITQLGRGQSVGQGTFIATDGTSGTLTTVETTSAGGVDVITSVYKSPAGVSTEQRTQTNGGTYLNRFLASAGGNVFGFVSPPESSVAKDAVDSVATRVVIKTVSVDPGGNATQSVQTRTLDVDSFSGLSFKP